MTANRYHNKNSSSNLSKQVVQKRKASDTSSSEEASDSDDSTDSITRVAKKVKTEPDSPGQAAGTAAKNLKSSTSSRSADASSAEENSLIKITTQNNSPLIISLDAHREVLKAVQEEAARKVKNAESKVKEANTKLDKEAAAHQKALKESHVKADEHLADLLRKASNKASHIAASAEDHVSSICSLETGRLHDLSSLATTIKTEAEDILRDIEKMNNWLEDDCCSVDEELT